MNQQVLQDPVQIDDCKLDEDLLHLAISTSVNAFLEKNDYPPLFRTDANLRVTRLPGEVNHRVESRSGLMDFFLTGLPNEHRRTYDCSCCRRFIKAIGDVVTIDPVTLKTRSLVWDPEIIGDKFKVPFANMKLVVERANVTKVFQADERHFGSQYAGGFAHMHIALNYPVKKSPSSDPLHTGRQRQAQSIQDLKMLNNLLSEYEDKALSRAMALFNHDQRLAGYPTFRARLEKTIGLIRQARDEKNHQKRKMMLWLLAGSETPDIVHFKNTVMGTFMDNMEKKGEGVAISEFRKSVRSEVYMRPTEAPKEQVVENAEKIISTMNMEKSFDRRLVTLADIDPAAYIFSPAAKKTDEKAGGFFADVATKSSKATTPKKGGVNAGAMSWLKFRKTLLGQAQAIQMIVPSGQIENWGGLLTAVHPDCTPILRWDSVEKRNHLSAFGIVQGSTAAHWGLQAGSNIEISGIVKSAVIPQFAAGTFAEGEEPVDILINNMKYQGNIGLGLFPSILRPELHGVRSVIEAVSNKRQVTSVPGEVPVSQFSIMPNGTVYLNLIVETEDAMVMVLINRFD